MQPVQFGDDVVFYQGADFHNEPMLAKVRVVACNGTVADLCVLPWAPGPLLVFKNVRHINDPHYNEFPNQKRYGGFATFEEHRQMCAERDERKRKFDEARIARENLPDISPIKLVGEGATETIPQMIQRLWEAGRIPAFICEVIDNLEWPLERVNEEIAKLAGGKEESKPQAKQAAKKEKRETAAV